MGSPSSKSQRLHYFQLHELKWATNHTNNHRLRKLSDPSQKSAQPGGDTDSDSDNNLKGSPACEAPPKNGASSSSSPDHRTQKSEKKVVNGSPILLDDSSESDQVTPSDSQPKIYLRSRLKNKKSADDVADQNFNAEDFQEPVAKTWNLRPRKPVSMNENALRIAATAHENKTRRPESSRSWNLIEPTAAMKEKKPKFSISLTKEEIEEDVFAMTGSKPSKKPKRRPKNVQKELDLLFPGSRLERITSNSYKVPETPKKGSRI
ncbi:hypothetical protein DITRI_Ditri13aG0015300 [Diplodiscus trichospermus]